MTVTIWKTADHAHEGATIITVRGVSISYAEGDIRIPGGKWRCLVTLDPEDLAYAVEEQARACGIGA